MPIPTFPLRLSECGEIVVLDDRPGEEYRLHVEPGTHLVVQACTRAGTPAARFTHPHIARTVKEIYDYKRDLGRAGKRYYTRPGVAHYFVIPRSEILLLGEKGYSYVKAVINYVLVNLSCSGGSGSPGWVDRLHTRVGIGGSHSTTDLAQLAAAAVRGTAREPIDAKELGPDELARWDTLVDAHDKTLRQRIVALVQSGQRPVIHFRDGFSYAGDTTGVGLEVERHWRTKHLQGLILEIGRHRVRAKVAQIDWHATSAAHPAPTTFAPPPNPETGSLFPEEPHEPNPSPELS